MTPRKAGGPAADRTPRTATTTNQAEERIPRDDDTGDPPVITTPDEDYFDTLALRGWTWRFVEPNDPCDRCGHRARAHADRNAVLPDWSCRAPSGLRPVDPMSRHSRYVHAICLCDGFVPVPP